MGIYYHVSSLQKKNKSYPFLKKGNKILQKQIDFCCNNISGSSYMDFIAGFDIIIEHADIFANTNWLKEKWMAEVLFETIRVKNFPELPSRMQGVFLSESLCAARDFNEEERGSRAEIYICDVPDKEVFSFNMNIFTCVYETIKKTYCSHSLTEEIYKNLCNRVEEYWSNPKYDGAGKEYLCELEEIKLEKV